MIVAARVILGIGVGLEGGTVPVYVAETVERRIRGNVVSLYVSDGSKKKKPQANSYM
jgi:MFS family permease